MTQRVLWILVLCVYINILPGFCVVQYGMVSQPETIIIDTDSADTTVGFLSQRKYRSLIIGQTYNDNWKQQLSGTINDVIAISECVRGFKNSNYTVTLKIDISAEDFINTMCDTFIGASNQDISLIYFAGHGYCSNLPSEKGALLGNDGVEYVTAYQLNEALTTINGYKVIIIDACYGGDFLSAYMEILNDDKLLFLTASAENENSYEIRKNNKITGVFTSYFCKGCGYDCYSGGKTDLYADSNGDNQLSFQEIYQYTKRMLLPESQHVMAYPHSCELIIFQ